MCCDTHLHVNTTRATVPALVRQKCKLFFFFQADKVWLWDYWLHIELEFCDISVQTWSLTSGKRRRGVTFTRNQISPPVFLILHMLFTKQQTKHSFIIPAGKSLWQLLTFFFFCKNKKNDAHARTHTHLLTLRGVQTVCTWNRHLHQNERWVN